MNRKTITGTSAFSSARSTTGRSSLLPVATKTRAPLLPVKSEGANVGIARKSVVVQTRNFPLSSRLSKVPVYTKSSTAAVESSKKNVTMPEAVTRKSIIPPPSAAKVPSSVPRSFGFMRPTMSSLAKSKPICRSGNSSVSSSSSITEKQSVDSVDGVFKRPLLPAPIKAKVSVSMLNKKQVGKSVIPPPSKSLCSTANSTQQDQDLVEEPPIPIASEIVLQVDSGRIPFTIYESDPSETASVASSDISAIDKPETIDPAAVNLTILKLVETPKFPCTRSSERRAKRQLQLRPIENLLSSSPPPSFDFTVNAPLDTPKKVGNPQNYDGFSTPIMNLSNVEPFESLGESVYYTPCAEV